jgi:hypothetical protein
MQFFKVLTLVSIISVLSSNARVHAQGSEFTLKVGKIGITKELNYNIRGWNAILESIEVLDDKLMALYFSITNNTGKDQSTWFRKDYKSTVYIIDNIGNNYPVVDYQGITKEPEKTRIPRGETIRYSLVFPIFRKGTNSFSFIEGEYVFKNIEIVHEQETLVKKTATGRDLGMMAEAQTQPPVSGKTLTNDDIISLVKAGLSDAIIVGMIQRGPKQFDLNPESLIKLKQAGVSNTVIEAMLGTNPPSSVGEPATLPLPSAYGYYVVDDGQLISLEPTPVVTKMGLQVGGLGPTSVPGYAMDGFAGEPSLSLGSQSPTFILYQQNIAVDGFHLRNLVYVRTKYAGQFNILGTAPAFFHNVYRCRPDDEIHVNLWRPKNEVVLRIEPVEGKSQMYRLTPASPLKPDRYVLYFENAIHPDGTVFAARGDRQASAFYFRIGKEDQGRTLAKLTAGIEDATIFEDYDKPFFYPYDDVWTAVEDILKNQEKKIIQSNKETGVIETPLIRHGIPGFPTYTKYYVLIEKITENSTKLSLKVWAYGGIGATRPDNSYANKKAMDFYVSVFNTLKKK